MRKRDVIKNMYSCIGLLFLSTCHGGIKKVKIVVTLG